MVIIRAVDVKKFRGMSNVNVSLDGDVVAIAGQNGTHKTTLLGMLAQPFSLSSVCPLNHKLLIIRQSA